MLLSRAPGATSVILPVFLQDSSSSTGNGLAFLVYNSPGMTCYYKRSNGTASVAVSLATIATLGTWNSGGFGKIDNVNQPGLYEFDPPDAAFASGADWVVFYFQGATNLAPTPILVDLKSNTQTVAAAALDSVLIESAIPAGASLTDDANTQLTAINLRQALALQLSALAAVLAGAATTNVTTKPAGLPAGNTRISATVDSDGNRSALTLKVPT